MYGISHMKHGHLLIMGGTPGSSGSSKQGRKTLKDVCAKGMFGLGETDTGLTGLGECGSWGQLEAVAREAVARPQPADGGLADHRVDVVLIDSVHAGESAELQVLRQSWQPLHDTRKSGFRQNS